MDEMKIELPANIIREIHGAKPNEAVRILMNYLGANAEVMGAQVMATVISKIRGSLYSEALLEVEKYISSEGDEERIVRLNKELHPLCDLTNDQLFDYFDKWILENESKIPEEVMYAYQHGIKGLLFTANAQKKKEEKK